jgi:WD40 repeat protein
MTLSNEPHQLAHEQHKVPVTSLEFYTDELLLAGEGTHLVAYSTSRKTKSGSVQVFRSQAIHRILINQTTKDVLVCGGSHVAFVRLQNDSQSPVVFSILARHDVGDWIFNAAFSPPAEDDSATTVALVTAHNALLRCTLEISLAGHQEQSLSVKTVVPGSNCVLYCAHISWLSASVCLVASGTAFGDIILWSTPFSSEKDVSASVKTHYIFQAHEGSVFEVQTSTHLKQDILGGPHRVLASCSDDRTVRLWDVSDLDRECASMTDIQRETGFGSTDQSNAYAPPLLSRATGHISRIWMIKFILEDTHHGNQKPREKVSSLAIASFGEDGSCITWKVETSTSHIGRLTHELQQLRTLPVHTGKNIWSATVCNGRGATGGADGLIALLPSVSSSPQVYEIDKGLLYASTSEDVWAEPKDVFRSYTFVGDGTVLATTTHGYIVTLTLEPDGCSVVTRYKAYESLSDFSMTTGGQGLAFIAGIRGEVLMFAPRYDKCLEIGSISRKVAGLFLSVPAASTNHKIDEGHDLLVTTVGSTTAQLIQIHKTTHRDGAEVYDPVERLLVLPPRFVATSFIFVQHGHVAHIGYAIIGSRNGALAIYDLTGTKEVDSISSIDLLQHCHGKESVTAFGWRAAARGDDALGYLFSTGRDGTYAIHQVTHHNSSLAFELVHQLELPFGPNIEGLAFTNDGSLHVWGFRGKQFVVHDVMVQQDVFTVECGGGVHRNWAYEPSPEGGTFIWTQNSSLMRVTQAERPFQTVRAGGHGREIRAVAISAGEHQIIATGAEDTDIKLFTYSSNNGFTCLQTLRKHNTGIQHLQWSADRRRLFSSAGSEEFYVWRACHEVPVLGVGVVCESAHPRSMSSDLRITGFDVRERAAVGQQEPIFDIIMAYSDSTVKSWFYGHNVWSLERSGDYLTACLTNVRDLSAMQDKPLNHQRLVTTATDGHLAIWHGPESGKLTWLQRRKVHQNAILDATHSMLSDGSTLLVTAGDDNGLGLSRIYAENVVSTLLIPRAHAAAVTDLAMYKYDDDSFYVLSASIDQRVKLWNICINVTASGVAGLQVRKVQNVFTSVADVSSMALLRLEDDSSGVLVCGVGMDIWRLQDTPPRVRN